MTDMHSTGLQFQGKELWITPNQDTIAEDIWNLIDDTGKVYHTGTVKEIQEYIVTKQQSGEFHGG